MTVAGSIQLSPTHPTNRFTICVPKIHFIMVHFSIEIFKNSKNGTSAVCFKTKYNNMVGWSETI